jgi:hypothetical protein
MFLETIPISQTYRRLVFQPAALLITAKTDAFKRMYVKNHVREDDL